MSLLAETGNKFEHLRRIKLLKLYIYHAEKMQEITMVISVVALVIAAAACYKAVRR